MSQEDLKREELLSRVKVLEAVIEGGLKSFVEVGLALKEIKENKLYRQLGYQNFEQYCLTRWKIRRNYANKKIAASNVVSNLEEGLKGTIVPKFLPTAETQIRAISGYESQLQCTIWEKAVEKMGGVPTARVVKETAKEVMKQTEQIPDLDPSLSQIQIGDICIIQSKRFMDLKPYQGYWCIIKTKNEVGFDIEVYDRTLTSIKSEYLLKLECTEEEKQAAVSLMARLQRIAAVETISRSLNAILIEFGSRHDFILPEMDRQILTFIENQLGISNN